MTSGPVDQLVSIVAQWLPPLVVVAAGVAGLMLPRTHQVRVLVQAVVALLLAVPVKVAGGLDADPRPFVVDRTVHLLFPHAPDNGFPSDHTTFAVAAAATLLGVRRRTGAVLVVLGVVGGLAALVAPRLTAWGPLRGLDERWSRTRRPSTAAAAARR